MDVPPVQDSTSRGRLLRRGRGSLAPFEGFRWRKDARLRLNFLWVLNYITDSPAGHVSKVWFDQIVVARAYIGPMAR
jgi:hypothetical protein